MSDPSRNLPATAKRIREARSKGDVPRSRDLGHFAALATGFGLLYAGAGWLTQWSTHLLRTGLQFDHRIVSSPALSGQLAISVLLPAVGLVAVMGLVMGLVGVAASLALGGWNFSTQALGFNFGRLNPLSGVMNLVSKDSLLNALKAVLLALVVGITGAMYLKAHTADMARALAASLPQGLAMVAETLWGGLTGILLCLAVWSAVDVPWQKYRWAEKLKMTREEVKREAKEGQGSSEVKGKIRQKGREIIRRNMMNAVPKADIVVMNPTHYAVALKYDEASGGAPRVVAKGMDLIALRIRDLARDAGVPVLEAPPLARALYTHVELDAEVPAVLFAAVAQVLAWVYRMRQMPMAANTPPRVEVPDELDPLNPASRLRGRRRPQPGPADPA